MPASLGFSMLVATSRLSGHLTPARPAARASVYYVLALVVQNPMPVYRLLMHSPSSFRPDALTSRPATPYHPPLSHPPSNSPCLLPHVTVTDA
ncbi:hypothetical protein GALMADRAFT_148840 [Galerina marginata CBS 339.88]|uniref:Uncharacterized protein n=1 Tax=Galerina marginata (strain CBS 339.88) TaxID=685588 RepID=A0A067SEQ8_GALM3|nr:hypothetical protein GALMADRAFT_148840 [Galerina marginata CBS 339.88]